MQPIKKIIFAMLAFVFVTGFYAANPEKMIVPYQQKLFKQSQKSRFHNKLKVSMVQGGEKTTFATKSNVSNADFKNALAISLQNYQYLSKNKPVYRLEVTFNVSHIPPKSPYKNTVTANTIYKIFDIKSGKKVYQREILTFYTATFNEHILALKRIQIANEKCMTMSIREFIADIGGLY